MTNDKLLRLGGLALVIGAVAFTLHIVLRSVVTAGPDPTVFAKGNLWAPISALGVLGSVLVLLGLPAAYVWMAAAAGLSGLIGFVLVTAAWTFFGGFLSLDALLVLPWLAEKAPDLVAAKAPLAPGMLTAFLLALAAWFVGSSFFAVPFLRGAVRPRWIGFVLPASALWVLVGNLLLAPNGPAPGFILNLTSNLAPVLLLAGLGHIGFRIWNGFTPQGDGPFTTGESVMSAYVIFDVEIRDMARYQEYMKQVKPAIEAAGGRYLARGGAHKVYEGDWQPWRIVLLEFPSVAAFESFHDSPTYQALKPIRDACSSARLVSVEGLQP